MNKVVLIGRLTRDPELKHTQAGTAVASFGIAVDRRVSRQANAEKTADFFDVECWDKQAEFVSKYFQKGKKIGISGRLQQQQWKDKEGNNRSTVRVIAEELEFVESKGEGSDGGGRQSSYAAPVENVRRVEPSFEPSSFHEISDDDGELPF